MIVLTENVISVQIKPRSYSFSLDTVIASIIEVFIVWIPIKDFYILNIGVECIVCKIGTSTTMRNLF